MCDFCDSSVQPQGEKHVLNNLADYTTEQLEKELKNRKLAKRSHSEIDSFFAGVNTDQHWIKECALIGLTKVQGDVGKPITNTRTV